MDQPTQQPQFHMSRAFEAVIVVVGGLVAAFFGVWAHLLYVFMTNEQRPFLGPAIGGVAGLAAGYAWVRTMRPRFEVGRSHWRLMGWGALFGVAVGSGATLLLHLALQILFARWDLEGFVLGLAFGVPAGAVTGAVAGLVGSDVAGRIRRRAAATAEQTRGA